MKAQRDPSNTFSPRVAITLFLVGVFSFSAFITLSTFAPEFMDGDDAQAHALSRSAIGYSGIVKLLKSMAIPVTVRRTEPSHNESRYLVVLTPRSPLTQDDVERLSAWRTLVILPKWHATQSMKRKGWVNDGNLIFESTVEATLEEHTPKLKLKRAPKASTYEARYQSDEAKFLSNTPTIVTGVIDGLQTISAPNVIPVLKTTSGDTILGVIRSENDGEIYVLSDPDLLNNQGIAALKTAQAGFNILSSLRAHGDPIAFDVTLNGFLRSRSLMRLALEPPLLALTLSFVLVSALIAWRAATRDGPTQRHLRKLAFGKQILADNSAALIRLAGREHTMAKLYADMVRTTIAERLSLSLDDDAAVTTELDRIAAQKRISKSFTGLVATAASASNPNQALTSSKELQSWKQEITRATQ